jgi:hypothetical protein
MLMPSVSFVGLNDLLLDEDCGPLSVVLPPQSPDGVGDDARVFESGGHVGSVRVRSRAMSPLTVDQLEDRNLLSFASIAIASLADDHPIVAALWDFNNDDNLNVAVDNFSQME